MIRRTLCLASIVVLAAAVPSAQPGRKWVVSWAASAQGPYPSGNSLAQPDARFAFPTPAAGARDQTFRLIVRPDIWAPQVRIRLSNAFGVAPVTFDDVFIGLQQSGAAMTQGTNRRASFAKLTSVTVAPGRSAWSDAVTLPFVKEPIDAVAIGGRKLAVSFHVVGESGPMTWHAKALTTSYLSAPGAGSRSQLDDESSFPFSTTAWYFLDALDVMAPADARAIVAFGDSITDGTASTLNGDDRWPDVLSRRLHAIYGNRISVVNAGIGGNQVTGPAEYTAQQPSSGGPSAAERLERDVLSLSAVSTVIWFEGINDFSRTANVSAETVQTTMREVVRRIRAAIPRVQMIGGTVTTALGSTNAAHGSPEEDDKRKALNTFIRTSDLFDGVVDFDRVTIDPRTGGLRPEFVPDSTTGGAGDKIHPNRAGYLAMGMAIDLELFRQGR